MWIDNLQIEFDGGAGGGSSGAGGGSVSGTFRDEFKTRVYSGSDGSDDWSGSSWTDPSS